MPTGAVHWGPAAILLALVTAGFPSPTAGPRVWVVDSLTRVQPTDPPGTDTSAFLSAARNESEAIQLVIQAPRDRNVSGVSVSISHLTGPGTIPRSAVTLYRAHYVPVRQRSQRGRSHAPYPPGYWPDALIPFGLPGASYQAAPFSITAGHNQPVWLEIRVPTDVPGGVYSGTVRITAEGLQPVSLPITFNVWDFTLPTRPALATQFMLYDADFVLARRAVGGPPNMDDNLRSALHEHRLGGGVVPPLATASDKQALTRWMESHRHVLVPSEASREQLVRLKAYFESQGWGSFLAHYVMDEPETPAQFDAIRAQAVPYRALGIPVMTTIKTRTAWAGLDGAIDIWVPVFYECEPALIRDRLAKGQRVWSYTAGVQPTGYPTWLLGYELVNFRIPAWLNYRHGQTGLLYWATAYWQSGDPWTNSADENGEGVLFYPGYAVGAPDVPVPSARLKAIRDGIDDYDYLSLLAALGDAALATQLASELAPAWHSWVRDPARLQALRQRAATRIVQLRSGARSTNPRSR